MHTQRNFLLFIALAAAFATSALGQTATPGGPVSGVTNGATSIPDFSRIWMHPAFPWFEPPASGPGPVTNKSRWPQQPGDASGSVALARVPSAAEVVKKFGEMSLAGIVYGNPSNQCWPMPMPFIYKQFMVEIIQRPEKI